MLLHGGPEKPTLAPLASWMNDPGCFEYRMTDLKSPKRGTSGNSMP